VSEFEELRQAVEELTAAARAQAKQSERLVERIE
jgi:hypothetical protein